MFEKELFIRWKPYRRHAPYVPSFMCRAHVRHDCGVCGRLILSARRRRLQCTARRGPRHRAAGAPPARSDLIHHADPKTLQQLSPLLLCTRHWLSRGGGRRCRTRNCASRRLLRGHRRRPPTAHRAALRLQPGPHRSSLMTGLEPTVLSTILITLGADIAQVIMMLHL